MRTGIEKPIELQIPFGAQARLDAAVKKFEGEFKSVINGLKGAYDAYRIQYTTYIYGVDVYAKDNHIDGTFRNITEDHCDDLIRAMLGCLKNESDKHDANENLYTIDGKQQIVWRARPEFKLDIGPDGNGRLVVYARLHF